MQVGGGRVQYRGDYGEISLLDLSDISYPQESRRGRKVLEENIPKRKPRD